MKLEQAKKGKTLKQNCDAIFFSVFSNARRGTVSASKLNKRARAFLYHSDKGISDSIGDSKDDR